METLGDFNCCFLLELLDEQWEISFTFDLFEALISFYLGFLILQQIEMFDLFGSTTGSAWLILNLNSNNSNLETI